MNETTPMASPSPPRDFDALSAQIATLSASLPKRLLQCARFVVDNPDEVALGTAAAVARAAGVQPSTLVRFAQALGYSGFSELQEVLKTNLLSRGQPYAARLRALPSDAFDTLEDVLAAFAERTSAELDAVVADNAPDRLARIVELLLAAETIYLLGLRRSYPVASYLYYAFGKLGLRCVLLDNVGGMLADRTEQLRAQDLLLAITFQPYSPEVAEFAETIVRAGGTVATITDSPLSPLHAMADTALYARDAEVGGVRSLSVTMCVASALAVMTAKRRNTG